MKIKGIIFDQRGQYGDVLRCNILRHYLIRADDICFIISSTEMVNLISRALSVRVDRIYGYRTQFCLATGRKVGVYSRLGLMSV